jgi:hypothetical protein
LNTQNQKGEKNKNLATKQHSSPQGYIVRPIKGIGKKNLTFINNFFLIFSKKGH